MTTFAQILIRWAQQPYLLIPAGVLLGISTALPHLSWLAVVSLLPFFALLERNTHKAVARHAFLFGFAFFGTVYWWFWGVYPLHWIGIESESIAVALLAFAWIMTASVLGFTMVAKVVLIRWISQLSPRITLIVAAVVWVLFEYVAAFTFSILWAGAQSTLGAHWTFGFLGYAIAEVPILRSLSAIGGVYMLSFAVVIIGALLYSLLYSVAHNKNKKHEASPRTIHLTYTGVALLGIAVIGYVLAVMVPAGTQKQVLLIHTNFPSKIEMLTDADRAARSERIVTVVEDLVSDGARPDIVLFPESSEVFNHLQPHRAQEIMRVLRGAGNALIINPTNNVQNQDELISSVVYIRAQEGIVDVRNKSFLVSVGEYAPYIGVFLTHIAGASEWFDAIYAIHGYYRVQDDITQFRDTEVATLQCSEIISPYYYRQLAQNHSIFANAASHAAFTNGRMMREQTIKMARIHAVANDRFFIQSGNVAPAFVITHTGAMQTYLRSERQVDALVDTVHVRSTHTVYSRWGEWFISLLALVGIALLGVRTFRKLRT